MATREKSAAGKSKGNKQPNILVIFGDDIGMWNVGACAPA